ncbi:single-stranded DNA exonuclease RecJ, partial [Candidatus Saccharibacteria bacterium]|nr:single-stranded DNA exonuclease RecJ [Candidatus Saccharibacteria bacterium]
KLVITVDCGSNNAEIIDDLKAAGVEVIVTDHHELNSEAPKNALAVVNPKRVDFRKKILERQVKIAEGEKLKDFSGLENLSGAGVAFMLAKALADKGEIPAGQEKWLMDLATIGIICDSMKLTLDNRIICKFGMIVIEKTKNIGLKELMKVAGAKRVSAEAIGFQIGPRLNAAGRMETAELALKLFLTDSKVEAASIAEELNRLNMERRKQQMQAVNEVEQMDVASSSVIIARGNWHEGIVGIIAGRITEKYKKPSFILAETEEGLKGSGRSFGEFNLASALNECRDLLISGGGHAAACGVKLLPEKYDEFVNAINKYYDGLRLQDQERFLEQKEDVEVTELKELNLELLEEMRSLEPFGEGNMEPIFLLPDVLVLNVTRMGAEGQHVRMLVRDDNGATIKLVAFNAPEMWLELNAMARVNIWVCLTENEWNGTRSVEGRILKIRY